MGHNGIPLAVTLDIVRSSVVSSTVKSGTHMSLILRAKSLGVITLGITAKL